MPSKNIHLLVIAILLCNITFGQKRTEDFEIKIADKKITNSNYNKISLIDIRDDTAGYGIVQKGAFNVPARVISATPLSEQLQALFASLVDSSAQKNELVLLLQHMSFAETTTALKELGLFHFRGVFFCKKADGYYKLQDIDTIVVIRAIDVTQPLLRKGNACIAELLTTALLTLPGEEQLDNLSAIINYDSLQKINLPLYTATSFKKGAYSTFESLVNQNPEDTSLRIEFYKTGHWKSVQVRNKKNKFEEVTLKEWYAFVFDNRIFMATKTDVYPVEKRRNDFYFKGKVVTPASTGETISMTFMFGLLGALAASAGSTQIAELKIDYRTGAFIRAWQH